MTEAEWDACDDPTRMVHFIFGHVSARQLITAAIALCRTDDGLMDDQTSRNAIEWVERVHRGEVTYDDPSGPSVRDCYLMTGAANRCLGSSWAMHENDLEEMRICFNEMLGFLIDHADAAKLAHMATICRSVFPNPFRDVEAEPKRG